MTMRGFREDRIKAVIAKHVPDEAARDEIWLVVDDVIDNERDEAYDNGMAAEREIHVEY